MPPHPVARIAEMALYGVFIFVDAHDVWPDSRTLAVGLGLVATIALLFLQMPTKLAAILSPVTLAVGVIVLWLAGPIPAPAPLRGWLEPANDPTPANACGQDIVKEYGNGATVIIVGSEAYVMKGRGHIHAILIGECPITLSTNPNGITVSAQLYDKTGSPVGTIKNNEYTVNKTGNVITEEFGDLSTLVVHQTDGVELLYVRYLNITAIRIRGVFTCPRPHLMSVYVTNTKLIASGNRSFEGNCFVRSGAGKGEGGIVIRH